MKMFRIPSRIAALIVVAGPLIAPADAALFEFNGQLQAGSLTGIPWVNLASPPTPEGQTTMWGSIETGQGSATDHSGFASLEGLNPALLSFTFGGLELVAFQSPGILLPGFERYQDNAGSAGPFTLSYDGMTLATGIPVHLTAEVDHINDLNATGHGQVVLTGPGPNPDFYNEVMALTSGSGRLDLTLTAFHPVNNAGLFATSGTFATAVVPEPDGMLCLLGSLLAGWAVWRRTHRTARTGPTTGRP